jgi:hypothetical protein
VERVSPGAVFLSAADKGPADLRVKKSEEGRQKRKDLACFLEREEGEEWNKGWYMPRVSE